jgi:biotin transport system substrate-specific component
MSQVLSLNNPLQSVFAKSSAKNTGRYLALFIAGIAILTLSAKIALPLLPVPMSLQTLAVLFIGMIYGRKLGTATVMSYVALGLAGIPVFVSVPNVASVGYIIGFIPAAYVAGTLIERGWGRSILSTALAAFIGTVVIYAFGISWLSTIVGFKGAVTAGLLPFLLIDLGKVAMLALTVPKFWK